MSLHHGKLFFSSLLHTRPRQIWHRLRLQARRHLGVALRSARSDSVVPLAAGAQLAEVVGPLPKVAVGRDNNGRHLILVGQRVPLEVPMNWKVPSIRIGRPLAELEIHYLEFLRKLDDSEFLAFSDDWIEANRTPSGHWWLTSWNSYGLSIRCVVWMQEVSRRWHALPAHRREVLCHEVARQIRFLEHNLELDLGGNHLLKNVVALLWASRFFAGNHARRWGALGTRLLIRELSEQVLSDGMHYERSPTYHCIVFADLLQCYQLVLDPGAQEELGNTLDRMAIALADLTHPDGRLSLFNDGGLNRSPDPIACLERFELLRGHRPMPRAVFALAEAGYMGRRIGDDLFLADCGRIAPDHLPAHGHGDILSFEWTIAGKRIVTDFGVYEYTAGPWRAMARATASHNTLTIDDVDQCEFWSAFRVGRRARILACEFDAFDEGFLLRGSHDGFRRLAGAPIHRRTFEVRRDFVQVNDEVHGGRGQKVRARILFHPQCQVTLDSGGATVEHTGTVLRVECASAAHLIDHYWCPDLGVKYSTKQLVMDYGVAPCRGRFSMRILQR